MIVAIPSKGRAGNVTSWERIPSGIVFCPANEAEAYERTKPTAGRVVAVPDDVLGITRTRNWILEWAVKNLDPWVVMVDDDLQAAGYPEMFSHSLKHRKMREADLLGEFWKLFEVTEDLGYRIWGAATQAAPRSFYIYKPFLWRSYATASCMGIRAETGIRFDESFPVKEDYEIGLRCVHEDGGFVAARFFYWCNSHWKDEGGCHAYRTVEVEEAAIRRLIEKYPGLIRKVTRGGSEFSIEVF